MVLSEKGKSNGTDGTGLILNTFHFMRAPGVTYDASVYDFPDQPEVLLRAEAEQQQELLTSEALMYLGLTIGTINKKAYGLRN